MQKLQSKLVLLCTVLSLVESPSYADGKNHEDFVNSQEMLDKKKANRYKPPLQKKAGKKYIVEESTEEGKVKVVYIKMEDKKSFWEVLGKVVVATGVVVGLSTLAYVCYKNSRKNFLERNLPEFSDFLKDSKSLFKQGWGQFENWLNS